MALKDNLKRLRERAGYDNGKELADAIGIAYPRYMTYERGSWPNEETLIKIATKLHVSINDLLGYQPPSSDDFADCKTFIEFARTKSAHYSVSAEPDNSVTVQKFINKQLVNILTFENKDVFIYFVQKLKHNFTKMHEYRFAAYILVNDYMHKLFLLQMLGYHKIAKKLVSTPLPDLTTLIDSICRKEAQRVSKSLSNPKNKQIFKEDPELQNLLKNNLYTLNLIAAANKNEIPHPSISPTDKEHDTPPTAPDHDGTDDEQTKEKAATPKSDGKEND